MLQKRIKKTMETGEKKIGLVVHGGLDKCGGLQIRPPSGRAGQAGSLRSPCRRNRA
jgi:hypothetical protein